MRLKTALIMEAIQQVREIVDLEKQYTKLELTLTNLFIEKQEIGADDDPIAEIKDLLADDGVLLNEDDAVEMYDTIKAKLLGVPIEEVRDPEPEPVPEVKPVIKAKTKKRKTKKS